MNHQKLVITDIHTYPGFSTVSNHFQTKKNQTLLGVSHFPMVVLILGKVNTSFGAQENVMQMFL